MSKTPEEMAEEDADHIERQAILCVSLLAMNDGEYFAAKKAYKAGYQAAQQWISVKERLPEINKGFIGFVENKESCNCYRYSNHTKDNSPVFYATTQNGLLICGVESISHWMPLPKPPEESK